MRKVRVAVLGATGAVGQELLKLLAERRFPVGELRLLASERSAGKQVTACGDTHTVQAVTPEAFAGIDLAFFGAGGSVSRQYAPIAMEQGAVVIDKSSAFRLQEGVPLVVPEVNGADLAEHRGLVASSNCSTTILALVLAPLLRAAGIRRVVVSTYQSVSGAGTRAIQELEEQVRGAVAGQEPAPAILPSSDAPKHYPIAFNLLPQVESFGAMGYTTEEWKMTWEIRKILHAPDLPLTATCVRVPVLRCHSESVNVETERKLTAEQARRILSEAPGVRVVDDPENMEYPMPRDWSGRDEVAVGRIRDDNSLENGVNLWVVGDQIRKGAALNAVQIAQALIEQDLLRSPAAGRRALA